MMALKTIAMSLKKTISGLRQKPENDSSKKQKMTGLSPLSVESGRQALWPFLIQ